MKTNSKQGTILKAVSKIALYSAKKACGSASFASFHQPKEPIDLMVRIADNEKRRNKDN